MARKPRPHVPGGLYHVMLRGNGGQSIFFDDDRYHLYLLMQYGVERYGHRIHGFCCMTDHIHLAIQIAEDPLSGIMQNLSFRYTRWINRKLARTGHLFQGRYKAILVDADNYLLELVRYIHLNPVRAGGVENPTDYAWSGHRAYLGEKDLRSPSRNRVASEARAVIGWLSRRLGTDSTKDVAAYFRREPSTFSRHIGKIDAKAKYSDQFRDKLNQHINAIAQACPFCFFGT